MFFYVLIVCICIFAYTKLKKPHYYWIEKGVQQGKPAFILGDFWKNMFCLKSLPDLVKELYDNGKGKRYTGFYQMLTPTLLLRDPELIKQITVKDFDHFMDHRNLVPEGCDNLWSKNIFSLKGETWRNMRATLSPSFTSSKMKMIYQCILECSENCTNHFIKQNKDVIEVDSKDVFGRFTVDVIASAAFGVKCDSLENKDNDFYTVGKEFNLNGFVNTMKFFLIMLVPSVFKFFKIGIFSIKTSKYFEKVIQDSIKLREKGEVVRPDMLQLLVDARKNKKNDNEDNYNIDIDTKKINLTDEDIAAQAFIFFLGGFDSTSNIMALMAYELAVNPEIQDIFQQEIDKTYEECNGKITYEALLKMKYLDMVISETLRKWPNLLGTDRVVTKPYTIEPVTKDEKPVTLNVNDIVWIPITALHRDPQYFPNPEKFDPERFSDENKNTVNPYVYLPFGVGPRNCIGFRFALLEIKAVFFNLLHEFTIVPTKKSKIPIKIDINSFSPTSQGGIWFGFQRRK